MKSISWDLETYSSVDLAKCGVYRYCESKDFEILLAAYSIDGGAVQVVDLACGEKLPEEILDALEDETVEKWSYNSQFERICLSRLLGYPAGDYLAPESWRCSMVWASTLGLPRSLESVGAVLGLEKQKLTEGKDLIRYFCVPCRPTKANGGRTRNRPEHDPEKWERFKAYNLRDVETEMQIQKRLSKFPVPDAIWEEYHLDQEINDRGIGVDMELVRQAIVMDARSRERLTATMQELTELNNPNSVQQMKQWLADHGLETDTLGKKAVAELIKTAPEPLREVLSLRQQLAKSSVKKYTAMENAVCADSRAHGMFQFYGANRTGRFSGRLIQLQNLYKNTMPDLGHRRGLWCGAVIMKHFPCSMKISRIPSPSLSARHLCRRMAGNSLWQIFPPSKRECWLGWPERNGYWRFLKKAETFTVRLLPVCSTAGWKSMGRTQNCARKENRRLCPAGMVAASVR